MSENYLSDRDIQNVVREYLRDNMRIHIEQDSKFSNSESKNIDVVISLEDEVICKTEFDIIRL